MVPVSVLLDDLRNTPLRTVCEVCVFVAFIFLLAERRWRYRRPGEGAAAVRDGATKTGVKDVRKSHPTSPAMPSLDEQERRIAAFEPKPFRADCAVTSNVPLADYAHDSMLRIQSRNGFRVTVSGQSLSTPTTCLDLATYDYHSFSTHPDVLKVARQTVATYGVGSCGPRGFYGTVKPHFVLEEDLARFLCTEEAVVYSFAYATISTLISCYNGKQDYIVCDEGCHSAVVEGCCLSRAHIYRYAHNDLESLEREMRAAVELDKGKTPNRRFVVTEGVFRNYGDICPLPEILKLCEKHKFRIILDDSYGFGALGKTGRGTPEHFNIPTACIDVYVGSISTSLGGVGGFCAGSSVMVDVQRLSASAYVFSASLPPYITACASRVLEMLDADRSFVEHLQQRAQLLRRLLREELRNTSKITLVECADDVSPVIVLAVPDEVVKGDGLPAIENKLQSIVTAGQKAEVLFVRNIYNTESGVKNVCSLRIVVKGAMSEKEVRYAASVITSAIKLALN